MKNSEIGIRWFNDACYELKLPNGKGILIDPYIDQSEFKLLDSSAVEAADYMVISHTHFDHVMNVGDLSRKFHSQIYVGNTSAIELAKYFDIPAHLINPCHPGETYWTPDFKLEVFWGKHVEMPGGMTPSLWKNLVADGTIDQRSANLNLCGSYEYTNYLITFQNSLRLMLWGGGVSCDAIERVKQFAPNIAIVQFPRNTAAEITELCSGIGSAFVFPHHHETIEKMGLSKQEYIRAVANGVAKNNPYTQIVDCEKGKWYHVGLSSELQP